jgi:hypothetical protein
MKSVLCGIIVFLSCLRECDDQAEMSDIRNDFLGYSTGFTSRAHYISKQVFNGPSGQGVRF